METIQIQVSSELARQLQPYTHRLPEILALGLRQIQARSRDDAVLHRRQVQEALQAAGLSRQKLESVHSADLLSSAQRIELGRRFAGERPLSDLIIEEREGR